MLSLKELSIILLIIAGIGLSDHIIKFLKIKKSHTIFYYIFLLSLGLAFRYETFKYY